MAILCRPAPRRSARIIAAIHDVRCPKRTRYWIRCAARVRWRPRRAHAREARPIRRPITLIAGKFGSRHFGTKPYLADALRLTHQERPIAVYIGAANGEQSEFGAALERQLAAGGAHRVLWPKLAAPRKQRRRARAALEQADLVFVGGGDVAAGMAVLRDADLIDDLHAAAHRGVVFAGMSAGAIMLGERWIRWPHGDAGDDEAETYPCLGLAPCSLDTHGEGDGWREAQAFAAVRARERGRLARAYAVPSGAALVVEPSGKLRARGAPVHVFAATPNRTVKLEKTLEAVP